MYKTLDHLFSILGSIGVAVGLVMLYLLFAYGPLGCSDALGFAYFAASVTLIGSIVVINKKFDKKPLYLILAFIISCIVLWVADLVIHWIYGWPEWCTIFIG